MAHAASKHHHHEHLSGRSEPADRARKPYSADLRPRWLAPLEEIESTRKHHIDAPAAILSRAQSRRAIMARTTLKGTQQSRFQDLCRTGRGRQRHLVATGIQSGA